MVITFAGRAVVGAAVGQRGAMEGLDHGAVLRLEGQVVAPGQPALRGRPLGAGHEQFVGPEEPFVPAADRHLQHRQHGGVEAVAGLEIAHHQLDVVDQAAAVKFHGFHRSLRVGAGAVVPVCPKLRSTARKNRLPGG